MCGITSPARSTTTVSPSRTSRRSTSSALWSVARLMVAPAMRTGSRRAAGVSAPVRPTLTSMARTRVVASWAGNLYAMAQRGWWAVVPEPPLLDEAVHLHDRAVRVVAEAVPLGLELLAVAPDVVEGRARLAARIGREPALPERRQHLRVGLERERVGVAQLVDEDPEVPPRGHPGILLAHRAGRGVARIGEGRLALGLQLAIEPLEGGVAHVDLAPDLHAPAGGERAVRRSGIERRSGDSG